MSENAKQQVAPSLEEEISRRLEIFDAQNKRDGNPEISSGDPKRIEAAIAAALKSDDYVDDVVGLYSAAPRLLRAALARLRAMEEGLRKYGAHDMYCGFEDTCNCGLDALLSPGASVLQETRRTEPPSHEW